MSLSKFAENSSSGSTKPEENDRLGGDIARSSKPMRTLSIGHPRTAMIHKFGGVKKRTGKLSEVNGKMSVTDKRVDLPKSKSIRGPNNSTRQETSAEFIARIEKYRRSLLDGGVSALRRGQTKVEENPEIYDNRDWYPHQSADEDKLASSAIEDEHNIRLK